MKKRERRGAQNSPLKGDLDQNTQFQKFSLSIDGGLYPLVMDCFLDLESEWGNIPV